MPVDGLGRRTGYAGTLTPERNVMAEQTVPLPGAQWRYGTRGEVWQIISGSRTRAITHGAAASAMTRTLTRTDSAASALALTSVETSTINQGMVSVSHTRSGFAQTHGLAPVSQTESQYGSTAARFMGFEVYIQEAIGNGPLCRNKQEPSQ